MSRQQKRREGVAALRHAWTTMTSLALKTYAKRFYDSVWFFPGVLTFFVIILVCLGISGSSIGYYHTVFYGDTKSDPNLLLGKPQPIRSDEYSVGSLMTIAQSRTDYAQVNPNVGNGEDVSVLYDIPYRDWSAILHPENLGFFILPFDNAFALKWWLPGLLLAISSYFFLLRILPGKRLLAGLLSAAFILAPFFQWWYLVPTLGSVYYCLFGILIFLRILETNNPKKRLAWSAVLTYVGASFILLFYPPFQIVSAIVTLAFLIGYIIDHRHEQTVKRVRKWLPWVAGSLVIAGAICGVFLLQRIPVINAISNTAYPGTRVLKSGEGPLAQFLASNTNEVLQRGARYKALGSSTNQSELSNFMPIAILLLPAVGYTLYKSRRLGLANAQLYAVAIALGLLLAWLFIPGLQLTGKVTLLDKVPPNRVFLGIGFANFIILALGIRTFMQSRYRLSIQTIVLYSTFVFIAYLLIDMWIIHKYPGYLGYKSAVILAIPYAVIVFLFLRKNYVAGAVALLCFTFLSAGLVNPLYRGTSVVTDSTISRTIRSLNTQEPKKWVGDDNYLENFALLNGAESLSATYLYPQFDLWRQIDPNGSQSDDYNRYAHVNFAFDRNPAKDITPYIYRTNGDMFYIITEACGSFLKNNGVGYLMTNKPFTRAQAPCATLIRTVTYPGIRTYIYSLDFHK